MQVDTSLDTAVFLGPSLPLAQARALLTANYFPPVRHGDLYRLRASGISKFVIIDGVFDHTTPIWHREILLLLREGCSIVGAASMGALRALELKPYGMRGFGKVYDWYVEGVIDGDDEVALFHTDETMNFAALSQPLVNIRHNLQLAQDAGVLSAANHQRVLDRIKQTYFGERVPAALYTGLTDSESAPLKTFFAQQWVDVKAMDASGVLQAVADGLLDHPLPPEAEWLTRDTFNGAETSMPVTYGACLVDDAPGGQFMQPHLPLLETLSSRQQDYEAEYHLAVQDFFLNQHLSQSLSEAVSSQDSNTPPIPVDAEPDAAFLARNGLTVSDWQAHLSLQLQIQQSLASIVLSSKARIAEMTNNSQHGSDLLAAAKTIAIGDWARAQGYPADGSRDAASAQDHCRWVLQTGPARLGFNWDPVVAVFQRLQFEDRLSELLPC